MSGLEVIVFLLASLGLVNIFNNAPVVEFLRNWVIQLFDFLGQKKMGVYLTGCAPCSGVWVGVFMGVITYLGLLWFTLPFAVSFCAMVMQFYWYPID